MKKLLLIIAMAIIPMLVSAYDFMVNGVAYKVLSLDNLEVEVTVGCEADNDGKLTIPATVEYKGRTFKVLGVGDRPLSSAIVKNDLYDLNIEEGPTYIGGGAFQGQHLTTIRIPKTITVLRDGAFEGNNWYMTSLLDTKHNPISLIIEDGEEMLTYNYTTFATTPLKNNVKYLYLGRNVNQYVLSGALDNVEDFVIGDMVTELTTESLTHLYSSLYNVKTITIGKGLATVPYMKEGDKVEKIYVRTMQPQNSLGFNDGTYIAATLYVPQGSKDAYMNADVWKNFWTIEEYDLENPGEGPNTNNENATEFYVNAIGYRVLSQEDLTCEVFSGNYGSEVHVPGEVTYGDKTYKVLGIGESAFQGSDITALSMDNSLTYIRNNACAICPNLRKVTIPPSVVNLGEGAFGGCEKLETFIIEDGDKMLEHHLYNYYFYTIGSKSLKTVYIGRNFSKDIFYGICCDYITDLTIGDHVTNFELDEFRSLLKLTIGKGLTYLPYMETGDYLTQITVKATTPISAGGFNNRTYLNATLYVPEGCVEAYSTTEPWSKFLSITDGSPTSINVSPSTKSIKVGESFTATYSLTPSNATTTVTWSSSDQSIAIVDVLTGTVIGINKGTALIYANTSNGLSDFCEVTVEEEEEVNENKFESIGTGTLHDNFYEGETQVEILQDQDNKDVFKILNPYDGITNMKGSTYYGSNELEIIIIGPGMTLYDINITKDDLVYFTPINTGYYYDEYKSYIDMYHPSAVRDFRSEDFWTYNKVLGYQNNGWPDKIQLAPYYYIDNVGSWDYTQEDNVIIITFPRDPTGIKDVKTDEDKDVHIYDLMGRRLEKPRKGINIIGGKKVYIK